MNATNTPRIPADQAATVADYLRPIASAISMRTMQLQRLLGVTYSEAVSAKGGEDLECLILSAQTMASGIGAMIETAANASGAGAMQSVDEWLFNAGDAVQALEGMREAVAGPRADR